MSPVNDCLKFPTQQSVHPVFHIDLLTPYCETPMHGPNYWCPPLDLVDGEEEYDLCFQGLPKQQSIFLARDLKSSVGGVHLTAVIQHLQSPQCPLPNRESLLPNQCMWAQTTEKMGAKHQKRPWPTSTLPTALATEQIGLLNQKQPCVKNANPYSGGLWSGKDATPDAQTAAWNTEAHTHDLTGSAPPKWCCKHTGTPLLPLSSAP